MLVAGVSAALTPACGADTTAIAAAAQAIGEKLLTGQVVIFTGLAPPGTARKVVLPPLIASGLKPGIEFSLACSPDPTDSKAARPVGGFDEGGTQTAATFGTPGFHYHPRLFA